MFKIGAHLSTSNGVDKVPQASNAIGGNTFQIFQGSNRQWNVSKYTNATAKSFTNARKECSQHPSIVHAKYLINIASPKLDLRKKSFAALQEELYSAKALGNEYVVFHPGSHTGISYKEGLKGIRNALNALDIPDGVMLLVENMAGDGSKHGKSMEELKDIIDGFSSEKVGICIDTCHSWNAGYDLVKKPREFADAIKRTVGMDRVKVIHLNDSKDPLNSRKDRHEHLGYGCIGREGLSNIINMREFAHLPFILETPDGSDEMNIRVAKELRR